MGLLKLYNFFLYSSRENPWDSPGKNTGVGCHFLLQCVKVKSLCRARLLAAPWTAAFQAPPSMGFSRQEYWSGVPLPSPFKPSNIPKRRLSSNINKCILLLYKATFVCILTNSLQICFFIYKI